MEITAKQLAAIEEAIGRGAEVSIESQYDINWWAEAVRLKVVVDHKGERFASYIAFRAYDTRGMRFRMMAERLVDQVNREIMLKELNRARW